MTDDQPDRDERGHFMPGNQVWRARTSYGRDRLFADPDDLRRACCEYFQWCDDNPLFSDKVGFYEGRASHEPEGKMRAYTIGGLCIFLNIHRGTWNEWRDAPVYSEVVAWADDCMRDQKFSGAAAGLLNSNIIARDLGLAENTQVSGPGGGAITTATAVVTGDELRAMIKQAEQDV